MSVNLRVEAVQALADDGSEKICLTCINISKAIQLYLYFYFKKLYMFRAFTMPMIRRVS
jgi:hypothetical protein